MCGKGVHSWTVSSSAKAVKLNRFHLLFTYISTSFSSSEEHPSCSGLRSVLCQPGMPSTVQISTQSMAVGWLMAKEEKSTFQISSLLLSSFISNIYTPEKGYYWQNQPNSLKVKGYQKSQLQCQATTALRKNSVHVNRVGVIEINVCERQGR